MDHPLAINEAEYDGTAPANPDGYDDHAVPDPQWTDADSARLIREWDEAGETVVTFSDHEPNWQDIAVAAIQALDARLSQLLDLSDPEMQDDCYVCGATGEGRVDGTRCIACHGTGRFSFAEDDDAAYDAMVDREMSR